jgi:phage shock protein PspC (stress-responsive transcriptional regulator)
MNKVITINLNGRAYQLEEAGYEALRAYLDDASARLAEDPGKTEIVADLEQAIAEKCDKLLTPFKTVVNTDEIKKIIDEMGPVQGDAKETSDGGKREHQSGPRAPKRFFLIREDAVFAGVCAGLAAYFDIDVTIVRVAFVALTVFTGGAWLLLYIGLAVLVPYADTAEAMAQAHGEPFNAEALVQRAKERWGESYERVTGNKWDDLVGGMESKHAQHVKWREMKRQQKRQWKQQWKYRGQHMYHHNPIIGLLKAALSLMWILAEISLISTGMIFGWPLPAGIPIWVAVIALFIVFQAVIGPMRAAKYSSWDLSAPHAQAWQAGGGYNYVYNEWDGLVDGLTVLFLVIAFGWAYLHVPQVYEFVHHPIVTTQQFIGWLKSL